MTFSCGIPASTRPRATAQITSTLVEARRKRPLNFRGTVSFVETYVRHASSMLPLPESFITTASIASLTIFGSIFPSEMIFERSATATRAFGSAAAIVASGMPPRPQRFRTGSLFDPSCPPDPSGLRCLAPPR